MILFYCDCVVIVVAVGYGAQAGPTQGQQLKGISMNPMFMCHLPAELHTPPHRKSRLNTVFFTLKVTVVKLVDMVARKLKARIMNVIKLSPLFETACRFRAWLP